MASNLLEWRPTAEADRDIVLLQLDRLLNFPAFRRSTRYPKLLKYLVEYSIQNNGEHLKERTIGVDVFGRQPDYDTNEDPIVRVTAGEVRKRLAQYYHEPGHEVELRIELLQFSYVPVFQWPQNGPAASQTSVQPPSSETQVALQRVQPRWQMAVLAFVLILVATLLSLGWIKDWKPRSATQTVWEPVLAAGSRVIVAVGSPDFGTILLKPTHQSPISSQAPDPRRIAFPDVYSVSLVVGFLGHHDKRLEVRDSSTLSFTDLQTDPAVMLGGFNNPWTLRATKNLRFHFVLGSLKASISDIRNSSGLDWSVDRSLTLSQRTVDYGIAARFVDSETGQLTVVAAGIGGSGTVAASEFLTDEKYSSLLLRDAVRRKNFEAVVTTQIINGKSGPPRVLATDYW